MTIPTLSQLQKTYGITFEWNPQKTLHFVLQIFIRAVSFEICSYSLPNWKIVFGILTEINGMITTTTAITSFIKNWKLHTHIIDQFGHPYRVLNGSHCKLQITTATINIHHHLFTYSGNMDKTIPLPLGYSQRTKTQIYCEYFPTL